MMKNLIKDFIPQKIKNYYNQKQREKKLQEIYSLPALDENTFCDILINQLNLDKGDTVFVHSSLDGLNLSFPIFNILNLLQDIVGDEGTLLFPTYPKSTSYLYLKSGQVFDIKKTPSFTGLISEMARRHTKALRSLHPTKSVVAVGKHSKILTEGHNISPYPYDTNSPYYKILQFHSKIIGLGVSTKNLSCIHCADDFLKDKFPVNPYHKELFQAECIDYNNNKVIVPTLAHNMKKLNINIPKFIKMNISPDICEDIKFKGMNFFRAESEPLIESLVNLAKNNITVYSKIFYK